MVNPGHADAQCFVSYHHEDDDTYDGVVVRLAAEVQGRFAAETGRSLAIFLDRDSIPGGGDWREKIAESIESATVFIPVITMRYFASQSCREELLAFYDGAVRLGVTELILPVVLAGRQNISPDDPRPEVRLIERLHHRFIDEAVDCGYQSPEWKNAIRVIVTDIAKALTTAEDAIAESEGVSTSDESLAATAIEVRASADAVLRSESRDGAEEVEAAEGDLTQLNIEMESLAPRAEAATNSLTEFGEVASEITPEFEKLPTATAKDQRAILLRIATRIAPVSTKVGRDGAAFEAAVRSTDRQLRGLVRELSTLDGEAAGRLRESLTGAMVDLQVGDVLETMDTMVQTLTTVAVFNVSFRRALDPGIRGIRAMRNAMSIVTSWRTLG